MTDQLTIAGATEDPSVKVTERQRFALELIGELGPIPSDELGAHMHERRGKHPADQRCEWCGTEGKGIGGELRKKGLVKHRREEGWYVPGAPERTKPRADSSYDPERAEIPF